MYNQAQPDEVINVINSVNTFLQWESLNGAPRGYLYYHPSAFGQAQPMNAIIQTPYGQMLMQHAKIGDKVSGPNGDIRYITNIHPRGVKNIVKITFSNQDSVECCEDHLWEVDSKYLGFKNPKVLSTKEIMKNYLVKKGNDKHLSSVYSVRLTKPVHMIKQAPSILSPYILGVFLGDGCLRCNSPDFTCYDHEISDRVKNELHHGYSVHTWKQGVQHRIVNVKNKGRTKNYYTHAFKKLLLHKIKGNKRFIPDSYLYVREEDRIALLQGLMDTDGTVSKNGFASFSSVSKILVEQVKWLVHSLGGIATIYTKYKKTPNHQTSYECHIRHLPSEYLFHLNRKRIKIRYNIKTRPVLLIKKIEFVGRKECQCITVNNSDGLYLTNNFIVTHNCLRKMQYQFYEEKGYKLHPSITLPPPTPIDGRVARIFANGHSMHERWAHLFDRMGILRGVWECSNECCHLWDDNGQFITGEPGIENPSLPREGRKYGLDKSIGCFKPKKCVCGNTKFRYHEILVEDKSLNFRGHADQILDFSNFDPDRLKSGNKVDILFDVNSLPKKPIVNDMKTINSNQFNPKGFGKVTSLPKLEHQIQLTIYINILDLEYGMLIYENKDDSDTKIFQVERNASLWDKIKEQSINMQAMVEGKLLPPPRPDNQTGYECRDCRYKTICHSSKIWKDKQIGEKRQKFYNVSINVS